MEDTRIVEMYWERDEAAIHETASKYGRYLTKVAYHILADMEDCKETVNDTYLCAWNSIPPHRPVALSTYLAKIVRQLSIDVFRKKKAKKRIASEYTVSLSELEECVGAERTPEQEVELGLLAASISTYLRQMPKEVCDVFVCRYFFMDSIEEISSCFGFTKSKVKSMLYRARNGLREHLVKEGYVI